jgi:hypothetical protein
MERTLRMVDEVFNAVGTQAKLPCDAVRRPVAA